MSFHFQATQLALHRIYELPINLLLQRQRLLVPPLISLEGQDLLQSLRVVHLGLWLHVVNSLAFGVEHWHYFLQGALLLLGGHQFILQEIVFYHHLWRSFYNSAGGICSASFQIGRFDFFKIFISHGFVVPVDLEVSEALINLQVFIFFVSQEMVFERIFGFVLRDLHFQILADAGGYFDWAWLPLKLLYSFSLDPSPLYLLRIFSNQPKLALFQPWTRQTVFCFWSGTGFSLPDPFHISAFMKFNLFVVVFLIFLHDALIDHNLFDYLGLHLFLLVPSLHLFVKW